MDVLSEVLRSVRLKHNIFSRAKLTAPWGVRLPAEGFSEFHYIANGSCYVALEESAGQVVLEAGDLVLIPHGQTHSLRDRPESVAPDLRTLVRPDEDFKCVVRCGGGGEATTLISGCFVFEDHDIPPLLGALPALICIRAAERRLAPWLWAQLELIAAEAGSPRAGGRLVATRTADLIFVQIVRAYLEDLPENEPGWLNSLRDRAVSNALGLIHKNPERRWTVADLARAVALSRSIFAQRFRSLVGEPPLEYVTRVRMQRGCRMLREGSRIGDVATKCGYSSEAAFSSAFKKALGVAPGAYRKRNHLR
jgi:AraC-like DNA-binding protein